MNRSTFPIEKPTPHAELPAECCGRCRFAAVVQAPDRNTMMICRRFPPALTLLFVPAGPPNGGLILKPGVNPPPGQMVPTTQCMFPPIGGQEWCGEFVPAAPGP